jgi:conjugative relaxase-like TrwC/TraI family protein
MRTVPGMLSTAKIRCGSWRYYANQVGQGACEYFLGVGEAPGRWYGRGVGQLGLEVGGEVREWQLEATFGRAIHPTDRVQLGRGWRSDGVTGYDLCFSAPKSVSTLWALGGGDVAAAVTAAHAAAVRAGLDYLDTHAAFSRVGRDGLTQVDTEGFAAAVFDHRTSRAGDPQLHTHALVLNKLACADGGWRTVDGHEVYAHKKSAGAIYQAALRSELTRRLGVDWTAVSRDGQAEIAGIPTGLIKRWSSRTAQTLADAEPVIAAYEAQLGRPLSSAERTAVVKVAVIKTRTAKEQVDIVSLTDRWHTEATELGWTPDRLRHAVRTAAGDHGRSDPAEIDRLVGEAVLAAGARKAVFSRSDLAVEVAARLPTAGLTAEGARAWVERLTDQALTSSEAVGLLPEPDGPARGSDARYASATTLGQELEIVEFADTGRSSGAAICPGPVVSDACVRAGLDPTQTSAVNVLTRSGDRLSVLVAPAGTGKTTTLEAAVLAWAASGRQVMGLAPSARAAKELAAATGMAADTVAKYLHEQQHWPVDPAYRLRRGGVLIVDEASMLATGDLHAITREVAAVGGKLLLVGDPAQITAIDAAGGMLPALAERLGAPSPAVVHRIQRVWERFASLQLRVGNPACIPDYLDHDRVHPVPSDADPYDTVLADYRRLSTRGGRVLLLARTHDDVTELNARARHHALSIGEVRGEPLLTVGDHDWRVGDRLRVTRNHRRIPVGTDHLRNGDIFTVTGRTAAGLTVQRLDGPELAVLPHAYLTEHATYGWASTIDTAQGATVDHSLTLARPGLDRTRLYVAMTRGRETNHIYLAGEPDPEITPSDWQRRPINPADQLERILATTGDTAAAHTRLPDVAVIARPTRTETRWMPRNNRRDIGSLDPEREPYRYHVPEPDRVYGLSR